LRAKADFFVSGMNADLTKKSQIILTNAIRTGELLRDTQRSLRAIFEPWVGNPNVMRDGEQIQPYRLETIIRTNATESFNRGRLIEARKAGDLVTGFEYSAIIDSKTTPICRFLDEKVFLADDPTLDEFTPSQHMNCRSVLVPILLDEEIDNSDLITEAQRGRARELQQEGFGKKPPKIKGFFELLDQDEREYHLGGKHDEKTHGRRKTKELRRQGYLKGRLFTDIRAGSALIADLGERSVFVDGRIEIYGKDFFENNMMPFWRPFQERGWWDVFKEHNITHAIFYLDNIRLTAYVTYLMRQQHAICW